MRGLIFWTIYGFTLAAWTGLTIWDLHFAPNEWFVEFHHKNFDRDLMYFIVGAMAWILYDWASWFRSLPKGTKIVQKGDGT